MRSRNFSRRVFRFLWSYSSSENVDCSVEIHGRIAMDNYALIRDLFRVSLAAIFLGLTGRTVAIRGLASVGYIVMVKVMTF